MRILLGGVPFGCNNIGDEAILECAVKIFRDVRPDIELTVCTNDPENTARKLAVGTCPSFGFVDEAPAEDIASVIGQFDVFVWCGATGLSDYPEVTLRMLRIAQDRGLKTVLWGVGMNSELNPAFYSLGPGRRRAALGIAQALTLGSWNAIAWEEQRRNRLGRRRVAEGLSRTDLVVVRDPQSREEVRRCGVTGDVHVGADSALILEPSPLGSLDLGGDVQAFMEKHKKKVGVGISAQRKVTATAEMVRYLDRVANELGAAIVFLPMNPITDSTLMKEVAGDMKYRDKTILVEGLTEPADLLAFLPELDLVISSRLHLLILASVVHVPIAGISRGSKVDNFLHPFGLKAVGSVEDCDFSALFVETERMLLDRSGFENRSRQVRAELLERLEKAKGLLRTVLMAPHTN